MATYSAGYLNVDGPLTVSTGTASSVNASTITATTINATTVNPKNLGITGLQNLSIGGNMTVGNIQMTGTAGGMKYSSAPFVPITRSSIVSIDQRATGLAFNGKVFNDMAGNVGGIGTYTYVTASVNATVNKNDPQASQIVDLALAQSDSLGNVNYSYDMVLLYPTNPAKYSGTMVTDIVNRGRNYCYLFNDSTQNDLYNSRAPSLTYYTDTSSVVVTGTGCGNGFTFQQGDMIVALGWEGSRPQCLSAAVLAMYPGNAIIGPGTVLDASGTPTTNLWPGGAQAAKMRITPANVVGLGTTFPICYQDASASQFITGLCQDEGWFSTHKFYGISSPTTFNSFPLYYSFVPTSQSFLTIRLKNFSTPITIDQKHYTMTAGDDLVGQVAISTTDASGDASMVMPPSVNPAYVTVNRAAVMADPLYYDAMDRDSSGVYWDSGSIYEMNYTAINPKPMALGYLGIRDIISYLRYSSTLSLIPSIASFANMTTGSIIHGLSQCGRLCRDILYQGYNMSNQYRIIFDGVISTLSGARRVDVNYRFSKESAFIQQHFDAGTKGDQFPFLYQTTTDSNTGVTDGLLAKYANYPACIPKIYQINSAVEIFGSRGSLCMTDSLGMDTILPSNVQMFYTTGSTHTAGYIISNTNMIAPIVANANVTHGTSPVASSFLYRSCYYNMKQWIKLAPNAPSPINSGLQAHSDVGTLVATPVPPNGIKITMSAGTLQTIKPTPELMGFPNLNNVVDPSGAIVIPYPGAPGYGLIWDGNQYSPLVYNVESVGVNYQYPAFGPTLTYSVLLPTTDASGVGNDQGGVPLPEMVAPLYTARGYNNYAPGYGAGEGVSLNASAIPLAMVTDASGDTRPTVTQLYTTATNWKTKWDAAVTNCQTRGFMLPTGYFGGYDYNTYTMRGQIQKGYLVTAGLAP